MPKARKAKTETAPKPRPRPNWNAIALLCVFLVAALLIYYPLGVNSYLLMGLLGALMAVKHIRSGETEFLIAVTAFMVITVAMLPLLDGAVREFLTHLVVGFGTAGFFAALGKIIKLGTAR
ncbi:MAG: hypothetical protein QXD77_01385 [Candidatus Aenigmatarchaeota archaeon]